MGVIMWGFFTGLIGKIFSFFTAREEGKTEARAQEGKADVEATKLMGGSWKDEYLLILFSLPLIGMFSSPFVDLFIQIYAGAYEKGDLLSASSQALANLDAAPTWYVNIIVMMTAVSFGYRKLINYRLQEREKK
jgi:hypothetical protein